MTKTVLSLGPKDLLDHVTCLTCTDRDGANIFEDVLRDVADRANGSLWVETWGELDAKVAEAGGHGNHLDLRGAERRIGDMMCAASGVFREEVEGAVSEDFVEVVGPWGPTGVSEVREFARLKTRV